MISDTNVLTIKTRKKENNLVLQQKIKKNITRKLFCNYRNRSWYNSKTSWKSMILALIRVIARPLEKVV